MNPQETPAHTPLPWVKDHGGSRGHIKSVTGTMDPIGWERTPTVCRYDIIPDELMSAEEKQANAEFIVTACNSYHSLQADVAREQEQARLWKVAADSLEDQYNAKCREVQAMREALEKIVNAEPSGFLTSINGFQEIARAALSTAPLPSGQREITVQEGVSRDCLRRSLLGLMEEISERCYCAGWLVGLENHLWQMMVKNSGDTSESYGQGEVSAQELSDLREFAVALGEWPDYSGPELIWKPVPEPVKAWTEQALSTPTEPLQEKGEAWEMVGVEIDGVRYLSPIVGNAESLKQKIGQYCLYNVEFSPLKEDSNV